MRQDQLLRRRMQVATIRSVQRAAAERATLRADEALRGLGRRRAAGLETLEADQDAWRTALSGASLRLDEARSLTMAIADHVARLHALEAEIVQATDDRLDKARAWQAAISRADAAADLVKSTARRIARLADEAQLNETADRQARGRAVA